jgi:transposase-like protein
MLKDSSSTLQSACAQNVLEVHVYRRNGTDTAAAFLDRLAKKHTVAEIELRVDGWSPSDRPRMASAE